MKAAFLTASISRAAGGVFEISRRLAQTMAATKGVQVEILGLRDSCTDEDVCQWEPLQPQVFAIRGPRSYGFAAQMGPALTQADPHLAHVHGLWMYPSLAAERWSRKTGKPYLITVHGMLEPWTLRNSRWKKKIAALLVEDSVLRRAACLHVNTEQELESVRAYGLTNPVCIIPNGIDITHPEDRVESAEKTEAGPKTLLYLGRLHPKKNLIGLLKGWALASPATPNQWRLKIVGWDQNNHEAELKALATDLGLQNRVEFAGPLFGGQKAAAFARAHAFVLPSFSEGLPMAVLEAWANRLPVLMTPQCNLLQGFKVGAALSMTPEPASIAEALGQLFSLEPQALDSMGAVGLHLIKSEFSWPRVARDLLSVYQWLLGEENRPTSVHLN